MVSFDQAHAIRTDRAQKVLQDDVSTSEGTDYYCIELQCDANNCALRFHVYKLLYQHISSKYHECGETETSYIEYG